MPIIKGAVVGFVSFLAGIVAWCVLYVGLLLVFDVMNPLSDQEEMAFKVAYVAISVISAALAFGIGWLGAKRGKVSHVLAICVIFALIVVATYPIGLYSSVANDCGGLHVKSFPFPIGGCD